MWSTWSENAKSSWTQALAKTEEALEKTGDALSKAATNAGKTAQTRRPATANTDNKQEEDNERKNVPDATDEPQAAVAGRYAAEEESDNNKPAPELFKNFQAGWSTVLQTTKASIKNAQEAVEEQQHRMQELMHKARTDYYKRDPKLPLDVEALQDAQVVYVTDRLITMSHPAMASTANGDITAERKLAAVGHLFQRRHDGRFMVWNLSEVDYDVDILNDQVLTFSFPGSPSPPLGLLLKILVSMEAWLKADDRNVAVVHCLTGKGRTSTVLAAFLCWMGQAGFCDPYQALEYIAACKQISPEELTIPSQRRYTSYFKNMLDGVRPSQPPLMLKRIIMSEAPKYAKGPTIDAEKKNAKSTTDDEDTLRMGCAPYLQLFKAGKLLHTAPASLHFQQSNDELPFCQVNDGSVSFHINQVVQGDVLVRCRHLTSKKQRVSMFRAAFHTGYVPPNVMRLTKSQLDGACNDDRFTDSFYLDFIFEALDAEAASKLLREQEKQASDKPAVVETAGHVSEAAHTLAGGATTVTASAYDTMLHRDSRFWDVISARRQEQAKLEDEVDPAWGPTVGRRRQFGSKEAAEAAVDPLGAEQSKQEHSALETFSIGGEFDFLPSVNDDPPTNQAAAVMAAAAEEEPALPKKDSLMEALMGALDDDDDVDDDGEDDNGVEQIVFENPVGGEKPAEPAPTMAAIPEAPAQQDDDTSTATGATAAEPLTPVTEVSSVANSPTPARQDSSDGASTQADVDDMEALLADADLNLDSDMDNLLGDDADVDDDLLNLDDDDLEDLEKFLSS